MIYYQLGLQIDKNQKTSAFELLVWLNRSYNDMTILSCSRILTQYKNSLTDRNKANLKIMFI